MGAGLEVRPGGEMARAPGEMKPCATAAVATHVSAAAVSSAGRKLWEGIAVLVVGPQGGAGASVQRGTAPIRVKRTWIVVARSKRA